MNFELILLAVLIIVQQVFWMKITNGLIAKLMSRNYHEYKQAEMMEAPKREGRQDDGPMEDLRTLGDFGLV